MCMRLFSCHGSDALAVYGAPLTVQHVMTWVKTTNSIEYLFWPHFAQLACLVFRIPHISTSHTIVLFRKYANEGWGAEPWDSYGGPIDVAEPLISTLYAKTCVMG